MVALNDWQLPVVGFVVGSIWTQKWQPGAVPAEMRWILTRVYVKSEYNFKLRIFNVCKILDLIGFPAGKYEPFLIVISNDRAENF